MTSIMEVYTSEDIERGLRHVNASIQDLVQRDARCIITRVHGKPVIHSSMQVIFNLKHPNLVERKIHELVMTHAMAAEKLGPGGFRRLLELLPNYISGQCEGTNQVIPYHPSRQDLDRVVAQYSTLGKSKIVAMIHQALHLGGFGGCIIVEKTSSLVPSVELVRGYTFDLQQILPIDFSFIKPRVVCIDGHVEEVAELHHLLESAASAREPCVLFIRGVSEDVKHTLKVNYDRGSLRVVPVGVRFDFEGMNTLVDIAMVTGGDLVSSLKGDLISNIKFEEIPCVEQVTMFHGKVVIIVPRARKAIVDHVAHLRQRRAEELIDDKASLLDKRIRSLSPNHVVIRLPDDKDFVINSQAIDYTLRAVRSAIEHGIDNDGNLVATELAARYHAQQCVRSLLTLGCVLS